jgi:hypothetical protein
VIGQRVYHELTDYVGGQAVYWIVIDKVLCYRVDTPNPKSKDPPRISQPVQARGLCEGKIVKQANGHRVTVRIPMGRGRHNLQRTIRRLQETPGSGVSFGLDYFTQSMGLKFHYPRDIALEVYGHGDLQGPLAGISTVTNQEVDQNEFDQTFSDGWFGRGANVVFLLSKAGPPSNQQGTNSQETQSEPTP